MDVDADDDSDEFNGSMAIRSDMDMASPGAALADEDVLMG